MPEIGEQTPSDMGDGVTIVAGEGFSGSYQYGRGKTRSIRRTKAAPCFCHSILFIRAS